MRVLQPSTRHIGPIGPESEWRLRVSGVRLGEVLASYSEWTPHRLDVADDGYVRFVFGLRGVISVGHREETLTIERESFVVPPEISWTMRTPGAAAIIHIPRALLERQLEALGWGADLSAFLERSWTAKSLPRLASFRAYCLGLLRELDEMDPALTSAEPFGRATEQLITLFAADVIHASHAPSEAAPTLPRALRACLDYMDAQAGVEFNFEEMAAHAGVSLRTAQMLFRAHLGTTITAYLRDLRLKRVRERLMRAAPGEQVTSIALENGFTHLGDFGRAYRAAFGEAPSATLRNRVSA